MKKYVFNIYIYLIEWVVSPTLTLRNMYLYLYLYLCLYNSPYLILGTHLSGEAFNFILQKWRARPDRSSRKSGV